MAMVRASGVVIVADGHHSSIAIHTERVEDVHVGFSGTDVAEGFLKMKDAHVHSFFAVSEKLLNV